VRSLIGAQLRAAIVAAVVFALGVGGIALVLAVVPEVRAATAGGIPIVWFVLGAGIYPLVLVVAALFIRTADRNEARYRSLAEET